MEILVSETEIVMKEKVLTELDRFVFEFLELIPEIRSCKWLFVDSLWQIQRNGRYRYSC
jgi:hypothetical protein